MEQERIDVALEIDCEIATALEELAADRDISVSELVEKLVTAELKRLGYIS